MEETDEKTTTYGKIVFYPEGFYDRKGRMRIKMVCLQEATIQGDILYARGSTVCSRQEDFSEDAGMAIAKQRAEKVLEWFNEVNNVPESLRALDKYCRNTAHMQLLTPNQLTDLEQRLFAEQK